jgi:[histone H3]-lysine4 N-trimethyltransferase ASH1L
MPRIPGLQVVRSSIDGYGLVAERPFAEGEIIAEVDGVAWRLGEDVNDRYSLKVTDEIMFDMVDQTRWINHSCDPNVGIDSGLDESGQPWAQVEALRDIAKGEEITFDYAFDPEHAEPCRCGSPRCRGMIIDSGE